MILRGVLVKTIAAASLLAGAASAREVDFNRGWRFTKGDPAGAEQLPFNDSAWEEVRTPHDWAISGPFDAHANGETGKLPWRGVGWYRKWLMVDRREEGSQVYLDFDGVMAAPKIYVNGQLAGEWDYGYTPFRIDITPWVRFGRANVVAVRVDTTRMRSRWYPGAGIFRQVTLAICPPAHLSQYGTQITTPVIGADAATVVVVNELENHQPTNRAVEVVVRLLSPSEETLSEETAAATIAANGATTTRHEFHLDNPQRWDIDDPALYAAMTELRVGGKTVDRRVDRFGVREARFTADDGFWLNGRRVELRGVNLHHDLGPLGAAFNRSAAERQLDIMQQMGVNAIRTAHNPPAAEVLDLCDQRGILVWDELFDKWDETAGRVRGEPDFEPYMQRHAARLVRRDRNHPSVIAWSIGNEIVNQPGDPEGKTRERVRQARDAFLRHDATRPVTMACFIPSTAYTDVLADLDLTGWNYQRRYSLFRQRFPNTPILYSESAAAVSTRGWYRLSRPSSKCDYFTEDAQINALELSAAPWADLPEVEFKRLEKDRYLAGEFVWTGFDYLGEPTPFNTRARSSYFGIVDLVGLPKDRYYLYRSHWRPADTTLHLAPHWDWPGREGEPVPVTLYTNGDEAELLLNGRSLGRRRKGEAPPRPENLAAAAAAAASSHEPDAPPSHALGAASDPHGEGWRAGQGDERPWLEVDLGEPRPIGSVAIKFPRESKLYGFRLQASSDGRRWTTFFEKEATIEPRWGGVNEAIISTDTTARVVRIEFSDCLDDAKPAIKRFSCYAGEYESDYYRPTYDYRLRWNDVPYEPGELRAVAYKEGTVIGETAVRTPGPAQKLVLSADRESITSNGLDVAFVTVSAVDAAGVPCPRANQELRLTVTGAGHLGGADSGNPLSLDPLQDDRVSLFHGKAVVVVRAEEGMGGAINLSVQAPTLPEASIRIEAKPLR